MKILRIGTLLEKHIETKQDEMLMNCAVKTPNDIIPSSQLVDNLRRTMHFRTKQHLLHRTLTTNDAKYTTDGYTMDTLFLPTHQLCSPVLDDSNHHNIRNLFYFSGFGFGHFTHPLPVSRYCSLSLSICQSVLE